MRLLKGVMVFFVSTVLDLATFSSQSHVNVYLAYLNIIPTQQICKLCF